MGTQKNHLNELPKQMLKIFKILHSKFFCLFWPTLYGLNFLISALRIPIATGMETQWHTHTDPWTCAPTLVVPSCYTKVVKTRKTNIAECVETEPWDTILMPYLASPVKLSSEEMRLKDWYVYRFSILSQSMRGFLDLLSGPYAQTWGVFHVKIWRKTFYHMTSHLGVK